MLAHPSAVREVYPYDCSCWRGAGDGSGRQSGTRATASCHTQRCQAEPSRCPGEHVGWLSKACRLADSPTCCILSRSTHSHLSSVVHDISDKGINTLNSKVSNIAACASTHTYAQHSQKGQRYAHAVSAAFQLGSRIKLDCMSLLGSRPSCALTADSSCHRSNC